MTAAKKDLIREAVEAIERAIALHLVDEVAERPARTQERSRPEWSALRLSLSSSIHSLNISLSLLRLEDLHSPADRLALRNKLVDDAKAAGREAYQSVLSLCDYAPN
ncbi:hypothetical protein VAR608DRAFT_5749 [Variovorax sp. HW608]|uniref:hypothetical protein n=1 Tax=Variovorax sp. HW608 TaxID=1034889 RepID=UPI00081FA64A|nr:hypothetical protein [Variovorax sp. HW608]SCK55668.1 hypothetical protein VAR608DRAFT_5749 [Variovorax sp. HW608]